MKRKREKRKKPANPPRGKDLLNGLKANADRLVKKEKQRMVETVSVPEQRKVMLIALDLLKSKNVKTRHVPMLFLERSGNAAAKSP